jgi:L,D-transpeptidase catalytic domain
MWHPHDLRVSRWKAVAGPLLVLTALIVLLAPSARSESLLSVAWTAPTPSDGAQFSVKAGALVSFALSANVTGSAPDAVVHIDAGKLPEGVIFNSSDGISAQAKFSWRPESAGDYAVSFNASSPAVAGSAATLTVHIHVTGGVTQATGGVSYPQTYSLANAKVSSYAFVMRKAVVRAKPRASAKAIATLDTKTSDADTQNLVMVLSGTDLSATQTWYHVRLPILPNNSTGWVRASDLSDLYTVHTHLYVDRAHFKATLKRNGVTVFTAKVGVGKSIWPTPRGEYYIRDELTQFNDPFYGPIAFGTSARSAVLTEWPGGGFVGIHGTNQPELIPGRISHGCIRMNNADIVRLASLMQVGTPLTIT